MARRPCPLRPASPVQPQLAELAKRIATARSAKYESQRDTIHTLLLAPSLHTTNNRHNYASPKVAREFSAQIQTDAPRRLHQPGRDHPTQRLNETLYDRALRASSLRPLRPTRIVGVR
ncbi:hypothetical protein FRC09_007112 [Ceratobasidium sp. 395]|nr:hypothetical protein FRC09_007112 [Ceratobasidium sp. 395]